MDNYFKIIDNFFTTQECQELINASKSIGYTPADISFPKAQGGPRMIPSYRNNDRVLYQSEELRKLIELRLLDSIPQSHKIQLTNTEIKTVNFVEVSGLFRFYRYQAGHYFKKHRDNSEQVFYNEQYKGISRYTLLLYLNTVNENDGGYTKLIDNMLPNKISVQPIAGRLLMFDHCILHEGDVLNSGTKYLLRTDLIYNG